MTPKELSDAVGRKSERRPTPVINVESRAESGLFLEGNGCAIASFVCFVAGIFVTFAWTSTVESSDGPS